MSQPFVLSVAGFDPCGGAGSLADIKAFHAKNCYGLAAVSALTSQDETTVFSVNWLTASEIIDQLNPLFNFYSISAIKIGIIESSEVLNELLNFFAIKDFRGPVIWDPVLSASDGYKFSSGFSLSDLEQRVSLITPNRDELLALTGLTDVDAALDLVAEIIPIYVTAYSHDNQQIQNLFASGEKREVISSSLVQGGEKHGSGCVFSSILTANLAKKLTVEDALVDAQKYMSLYFKSGQGLLGNHRELSV